MTIRRAVSKRMARNVLLPCAAAAALLTLTPVLSQSKEGKVQKVPVGAVAAQLTGRLAGGRRFERGV
jgi:hypothetical protein